MVIEKIAPFDYKNVKLKKSHWEQQRAVLIETYLEIDNDDLLHYFRKLAGVPDKGFGLTGWYGDNASTFGQKLGAMAKLYINTGDERLRTKATFLADEWGKCAEQSEKVCDVNDTYVYDKLMGGFLDMYETIGYTPALDYIKKLTESAMKRFPRNISRDGLQDGALVEARMIEWYTLPEHLYRAWQITGEEIYRDFAKEWEYSYYYDKLSAGDFQIGPRHAYSHVNSLSSAAKFYEDTGDEKYLTAMKNGYDEILEHHSFATGGYGPAECLFPDAEGYLGDSLKANWDRDRIHKEYRNFGDTIVTRDDAWGSCEVSCCAWAVFKLTGYLMRFTGEAKYGDWAEKMLYNGTGGQPPITNEGKVMYYADYFINGGIKTVEDRRLHDNGRSFEWQCCTGTFPQDVAEYVNLLYYKDQSGLYVSQYLPSQVIFEADGKRVEVENISLYPKTQELKFIVHTEEKTAFDIHFRVPSWATGHNKVKVNGEILDTEIIPGTWMTLHRSWKEGDIIEIHFPFMLHFEKIDEYSPDVAALMYGPLVLVCDKMTVFQGDVENPDHWIKPSWKEGYSYCFETLPGHVKGYNWLTRTFYPYYEVPELKWYYMYNRFETEYKIP